jgi:hypothetical protein
MTVQFYTTRNVNQSVATLRALGGTIRRELSSVETLTSLSLEVPIGHVVTIANWPDIFNVEPYVTPRKRDEAQGQIVAGNVTAAGGDVVVDGIDNGTATPMHPDFFEIGSTGNPNRLVYNQDCTADPSANGVDGHGNINASIVGAYNNLVGSPPSEGIITNLTIKDGCGKWNTFIGMGTGP